MEELIAKLNSYPDTYFGFVAGITAYAKKNPERLQRVMQYINTTPDATTSDIVKFVMQQPDFHDDGLGQKESVYGGAEYVLGSITDSG